MLPRTSSAPDLNRRYFSRPAWSPGAQSGHPDAILLTVQCSRESGMSLPRAVISFVILPLVASLVFPLTALAHGVVRTTHQSAPGASSHLHGHASQALQATAPANLNLTVTPFIMDVGSAVQITVSAKHFPQGTKVVVSFLSPHHGFTGAMTWTPQCSCFRLDVLLARRIHPLESARVTATIKVGQSSYVRKNNFQIRGLAPDGKHFAPGGTPYLASWVSDSQPVQNESEHFCAWTRARDSFPISGTPVTFVVHYQSRTARWFAGFTGATGVICSSKNIFHARVGYQVKVDVYAGKLHGQASFTPR
jgi:hypothetical protein